ncbi:MAG: PAS domain S-box protein [Bacteroidetes bacterium]|nr:PAS domain S-box protein [Bacteroidota bacterium]
MRKTRGQNQQDINAAFDTIDDFLFILDMSGNMIHFNSTVNTRLGYKKDELLNKHVLKVHPADRHDEASQKVKGMLMGTETVCRVPLLTKNGLRIPVETIVKLGKWGGKDAIIGISRDTSQLQNYERQIKDNSERLEMALMAHGTGLWDWNLTTNELMLNDQWASLRGYEPADTFNSFDFWKSLIHPEDVDRVMGLLTDHLSGKTSIFRRNTGLKQNRTGIYGFMIPVKLWNMTMRVNR